MRSQFISAILIGLLVVIHAQLWFGQGSIDSVLAMQKKLASQTQANTQAQQDNEQLTLEVHDLKDGSEMIEEKARLELGMLKPNELYVQIVK